MNDSQDYKYIYFLALHDFYLFQGPYCHGLHTVSPYRTNLGDQAYITWTTWEEYHILVGMGSPSED